MQDVQPCTSSNKEDLEAYNFLTLQQVLSAESDRSSDEQLLMSVFPEHFGKDEKELSTQQGSGSYDDEEHRVNTQHSLLALRTIDDDSSEEEPNELSLTFMPGN